MISNIIINTNDKLHSFIIYLSLTTDRTHIALAIKPCIGLISDFYSTPILKVIRLPLKCHTIFEIIRTSLVNPTPTLLKIRLINKNY